MENGKSQRNSIVFPGLIRDSPLDFPAGVSYNPSNQIGQFVTILSVNKTREKMGANALFFILGTELCPFFRFGVNFMRNRSRFLAHGALIAALYVVLTHFQNILIPDSASFAIQFRVSEALCVLAFFTPAAIPGITLGCLLFNISFSGALPLDFLVGSLASLLATLAMYLTRNLRLKGFPLPGLLMPALFNAVLVGWELTFYIGGGFGINALLVAIGEAVVLLTLGSILFYVIRTRHLDSRLFG